MDPPRRVWPGFLILTNSPVRGSLSPVLPAEHSKSRDGLWPSLSGHLEKAFETFLETPLSRPYINNLLQCCHCLPSRQGSREERFQSKCEVLSGCAWPNLHQGASGDHYCQPNVAEALGVWRMRCFTAQREEELSDYSFEFPNTIQAAWAGGLPSCLLGDRAGRGKQMKGGAESPGLGAGGTGGPASACTFQKLMLAGKNSQFHQNPVTPYRTPRVDLGLQCQV